MPGKLLISFLLIVILVQLGIAQQLSGPRIMALGGSGICVHDVWSVVNNPATLAYIKSRSVAVASENRFMVKQLYVSGVSGAVPIRKGGVGISCEMIGNATYRQVRTVAACGLRLIEKLSIGLSLNCLNMRYADVYGHYILFSGDIGFRAQLSQQLIVGGRLHDLSRWKRQNYANERVPALLGMGIQYIASNEVNAQLEAEKGMYTPLCLKGGVEYKPVQEIYLRGGLKTAPLQASFGFGLRYKNWGIDLCSVYHRVLGCSPQFGLIWKPDTMDNANKE